MGFISSERVVPTKHKLARITVKNKTYKEKTFIRHENTKLKKIYENCDTEEWHNSAGESNSAWKDDEI